MFCLLTHRCDMEDKRVISKERGETIARENSVKFLETSAKTNVNIERAFTELSECILDKFPGVQEPTSQPLQIDNKNNQRGQSCCT